MKTKLLFIAAITAIFFAIGYMLFDSAQIDSSAVVRKGKKRH